jgi:hypothetical protein
MREEDEGLPADFVGLGRCENWAGTEAMRAAVLGWKGRLASSSLFFSNSFLKQANKFEFKPGLNPNTQK